MKPPYMQDPRARAPQAPTRLIDAAMDFRIADTFTNSLARLPGDEHRRLDPAGSRGDGAMSIDREGGPR